MQEPQREASTGKNPRAFPVNTDEFYDRGMLLRDYFAAAALTGLIASSESGDFAERAYAIADDMLAKRRRPAPDPG